jgi:hypothetical protein
MARTFSALQTDFGSGVVIERADGYYWKIKGNADEHGPFAFAIDAISAMQDDDLSLDEEGADDEADYGVGAAAWTDPDSGRLSGVAVLRLEEYY